MFEPPREDLSWHAAGGDMIFRHKIEAFLHRRSAAVMQNGLADCEYEHSRKHAIN